MADAYTSVTDIVPTLLDLAHIPQPKGTFQGRAVTPIRGKSWVPYLARKSDHVHPADEPIGTELFGSRALRQGDWKITDLGDGTWRLFDLAKDPGETNDLSLAEPDRKAKLIAAWNVYTGEVGVILPSERLYKP